MKTMIFKWTSIFTLIVVASCASDLPLIKKLRNPGGHGGGDGRATVPGLEYLVDFQKVELEELVHGSSKSSKINLHDFMEKNQKEFLLLVFSSSSCHACDQEEKHLLTSPPAMNASEFAIVGINVDSGSLRQRFLRKWQSSQKETIVQLTDEAGQNLRAIFLPQTERYVRVPFVALVYKGKQEGVVWSYTADTIPEYTELRDKVNKSLDLEIGEPSEPDDPDEPTEPTEPSAINRLALTTTKRFEGTTLKNCQGQEIDLSAHLQPSKFHVLQIAKNECGDNCQQNRETLSSLDDRFENITVLGQNVPPIGCQSPTTFMGGEKFYSTFKTHFNGANTITMNDQYNPVIAELEGPLTLIFSPAGKLVYSSVGLVAKHNLENWVGNAQFDTFAPGYDFTLFNHDDGKFSFANKYAQADITMVSVFGKDCGECLPKLQKWSEPNNLIDQCESSGRCQFFALEDGQPLVRNRQPNLDDWNAYYEDILARLRGQAIKASLIMDPTPFDPLLEFPELKRFFDGYLMANFPEWENLYGTVVYDREGKIIKNFSVFLETDAIAKWLQKYIEESSK